MLIHFLLVLLVMVNALSVVVVLTMFWRRGALSTRPALSALAFAAFLYAFGYGLELTGTTLEWKRYALAVEYLGIAAVPAAVTMSIARFAGAAWLASVWARIVTIGGGVVTYLAVLTSPRHAWFYVDLQVVEVGPLHMLDVHPGPIYVGFQVLVGASILLANVALFRAWRTSTTTDRGRLFTLMVASLVPWIANLTYLTGLIPWRLDGPPFFILPIALLFGWSIRTQGLVNLRPIARDEVVERMREPVVVLDTAGRVVDANPAGRRLLLRLEDASRSGPDDADAYPELAPWIGGAIAGSAHGADGGPGRGVRHLTVDGRELRVGELNLRDGRGRPRGRVLVFHDVTRYARQQRNLEQLATTDDLTGLLNRRAFFEIARRWLGTAGRQEASAWLVVDVDHFKQVNDRHGHETGDRVLRAVAREMLHQLRSGDVVARLGGEEFVALLPGTGAEPAVAVAERLRKAVEALRTPEEDGDVAVTVSIGICPAQAGAGEAEPLLALADEALYRAKRNGRNRVETARPVPVPASS